MKHLHTFEVWQMRNGKAYARLPDKKLGSEPVWYELSATRSRDVFMFRRLEPGAGDQLEIEFSDGIAESSKGSLFPE